VNEELSKCYELLGVAPGASARELKQAYHDLAKVWHPDRFAHDPRLQQKAQEKLKEINDAYEQLTSGSAARRTRPASAPSRPDAPPAPAARRKRPLFILTAAVVFVAAFFVALNALTSRGARRAPEPATPSVQGEARPAEEGRQPDGAAALAPGQPARARERAPRQTPAEAAPDAAQGATQDTAQESPPPRPLPTVTVTIDAANGLLATRDCPAVSRMTYPAGSEPKRHCAVTHKTKATAQAEPSRLKSVAKRVAAPVKWVAGGGN
jgi:hypothetical protein